MILSLRFSLLPLILFCATALAAQNAPGGETGAATQDTPPVEQPAATTADNALPVSVPSAADAAFTAFIQGLRSRAIAEGVKPETFDRETAGLTFNPRVIHFDRSQPGGA